MPETTEAEIQADPKRWPNLFVIQIAVWLFLTATFVGLFIYAATSDHSKTPSPLLDKTRLMMLPGRTSHGHYQIELACNACHTPNMGVKQDACMSCHEEELKVARDTHPAKKFNDPTNAQRLQVLDAQKCITCHREHVPDRTHPMGLSLPTDYCYHYHKDVMEERPSHADFAFNSCATAGCHNYHDNRALYENFLKKHTDEPDVFDNPHIAAVVEKAAAVAADAAPKKALTAEDQDAPEEHQATGQLLHDWSETLHAKAGVNCSACHVESAETGWLDKVSHETCAKCHESEVAGWLKGRHGMRASLGLTAMTPNEARLPMKSGRAHEQLNCSSCHGGHRFDTKTAAVDACLTCHNDAHSRAYQESSHYELWKSETEGQGSAGTGVSCATCHMPRCENEDGEFVVEHNQNDNLRPNEKMIRSVCINCHGVGYSIDALADRELVDACFAGQASSSIDSLKMVKEWFESRKR